MPFEGAKGLLEKVLPGVSVPILMRMVVPGALATGVIYPLTGRGWQFLQWKSPSYDWPDLILVVAIVILSGTLLSALSGEIYKVYEGRIFWPRRLFERATAWQQKRVERLLNQAERAKAEKQRTVYNEIWHQLRVYPLDDGGEPHAPYPTLLGNILAGYEDYPDNRYGMDSVFFWPRLWLLVEKEKKEEIDSTWSVADGLLSLSAAAIIGGVAWILDAALHGLEIICDENKYVPWHSPDFAALAGIGWLVLGYLVYRVSLPYHRANGEMFKSLFDLYRDKIWSMTTLKPHEQKIWDATWAYLQYLRIRCPHCGKLTSISKRTCQQCNSDIQQEIAKLRESGNLPIVPE